MALERFGPPADRFSELAFPRYAKAAARRFHLHAWQALGQVLVVALVTHVPDGKAQRLLRGKAPGGADVHHAVAGRSDNDFCAK